MMEKKTDREILLGISYDIEHIKKALDHPEEGVFARLRSMEKKHNYLYTKVSTIVTTISMCFYLLKIKMFGGN